MSEKPLSTKVVQRALASLGKSSSPVYEMVARVLSRRHPGGGTLVDVGCGRGELRQYAFPFTENYIGADVLRYEEFPADAQFAQINVETGKVSLEEGIAEVVAAAETIEHVENPRFFFRELCRLAKPGGLVVVTTPNQHSLLSKFTFLIKNEFNAFQEGPGLYPAHIAALLEVDLLRIARECGLQNPQVEYSNSGRVPFTAREWPTGHFQGRLFSDNLALSAKNPS